MVVLSFDSVVAESGSELKMHVEISSDRDDVDGPTRETVNWLNPHTAYFMAPSMCFIRHRHRR